MLFYKITAIVDEKVVLPRNKSDDEYQALVDMFRLQSEEDYQKCGRSHYFFVTKLPEKEIHFIALFREKSDVTSEFENYINPMELRIKEISVEETLLRNVNIAIRIARSMNLSNSHRSIFKDFEIDELYSDFSEKLLDGDVTKEHLTDIAKSMLLEETLLPEIERIYAASPVTRVKGHPVHYLVCFEDRDNKKEICNILLDALYANERIQSKRICCVDFDPSDRDGVPVYSYDALYKSCEGGAIVVQYTLCNENDSDRATPGRDMIETLCDTAKKYRNRVLTVFCISSEYIKTKNIFLEEIAGIPLVELYENRVRGERAKEYLALLAKRNDMPPDKRLYQGIEDDERLYHAAQLKRIFQEWYNHQLLHYVYPQYKEANIMTSDVAERKPKGSAIDELEAMIGLKEAKAVIHKALNYYKVQKIYKDKGMSTDKPAMHMVFTGNPGTAKTTVARLFAEIMRDNELLTKGDLYEVGRADLVGKYVGWTAKIVKDRFKAAKGSVLFIDEAYSLVDDKDGLYGDEAINTIVQEMENNRENMIVIFAGYPDKMEQFLNRNPGLRSRIAFHVPFEDYDTDELVNIAKLIAKKQKLTFTQEAYSRLVEVLDIARNTEDFGNGRYVRNLIEQARMEQAGRIAQMKYEDVTEETLNTLTADDIPQCEMLHTREKHRIGFSI